MYNSVMKRLKVFYQKYIFENLYTQDYQNSKQESTVYLLLSALRCTQYDHLHLKCYLQVNRLFFFKTFKYSYYCRSWLSRKITVISLYVFHYPGVLRQHFPDLPAFGLHFFFLLTAKHSCILSRRFDDYSQLNYYQLLHTSTTHTTS